MDDDKKRKLRGVLTLLAVLLIGVLVGRGTAAENPTCGYVLTPALDPEPAADGTGSGGLDGDGSG